MDEVARELRAWITPVEEWTLTADYSEYHKRLAAAVEPTRRQDRIRDEQVRAGSALLDLMSEKLSALGRELLGTNLSTGQVNSNATVLEDCKQLDNCDLSWRGGRCVVTQGPGLRPVYLWSGIGLELRLDGWINIIGAHVVAVDRGPHEVVWQKSELVAMASALQEQAASTILNGLGSSLSGALKRFTELVEATYLKSCS